MTTARIQFKEMRLQKGDERGKAVDYIMKHGDSNGKEKKILKRKGKIANLKDRIAKKKSTIKEQCRKAKEKLDEHSLPEEEGPYADVDDNLKEMAETIDQGDMYETIEAVIDIFRPYYGNAEEEQDARAYELEDFKLLVNIAAIESTEGLITAGQILAEEERAADDNVSGEKYWIVTDFMEAVMLAVGTLRQLDIPAYPAITKARIQNEEIPAPVIAVLDPESETPLVTFNLYRSHPPVGAVDILSDVAMQGVTYGLMAINEAKKFANEIINRNSKEEEKLSDKELEERLDGIGALWFEAWIRWEENAMIEPAVDALGKNMLYALTAIEEDKAGEGVLESPSVQEIIAESCARTAGKFVEIAAHKYKIRVAKEMAGREEQV